MDPIVVAFRLEKSTKNTYRYKEEPRSVGNQPLPPIVGTLYIQKYVFGNQPPVRLFVTITTPEE